MDDTRFRLRMAMVLRVLVTLAFVPFLANRMQRYGRWVDRFEAWGYPGWGVLLVTAIEALCLAALWIPDAKKYAIGVLATVLVGAAGTWLVHGPPQGAAPALGILFFL